MIKRFISGVAAAAIILAPALASAHVVVTPSTANVGQEVLFSISVPNEEQVAVTNLKLDMPDGVSDVTPTSKAGWTITTSKGDGSNAEVTAITWMDGQIPAGQRDDFTFSAQVPAKATQLDWKAYQTYADGTVVHWDQKPAGSDDSSGTAGPYSVTKVSNDLTASAADTKDSASGLSVAALIVGLVALIVAIGGILFRKK